MSVLRADPSARLLLCAPTPFAADILCSRVRTWADTGGDARTRDEHSARSPRETLQSTDRSRARLPCLCSACQCIACAQLTPALRAPLLLPVRSAMPAQMREEGLTPQEMFRLNDPRRIAATVKQDILPYCHFAEQEGVPPPPPAPVRLRLCRCQRADAHAVAAAGRRVSDCEAQRGACTQCGRRVSFVPRQVCFCRRLTSRHRRCGPRAAPRCGCGCRRALALLSSRNTALRCKRRCGAEGERERFWMIGIFLSSAAACHNLIACDSNMLIAGESRRHERPRQLPPRRA